MLGFILVILLAYLLGSVPFGLVLTRLAGLGDIRVIGSGNIGATNVLRTGCKGLAALTVLCDGGKGAVAVLLAEYVVPGTGQFAGLAALLGHMFPVWLRFKGGKGVATMLGIWLALSWPAALTGAALWVLTAAITRTSSLAALVAVGFSPFLVWFFGPINAVWLATTIAVLVFLKHKANIRRLIAGTEPRIKLKSDNAPPRA